MNWFNKTRERPWRITLVAVGGLLVAIVVAGVLGLALNRNVKEATDEALRYDVELEDHADDLRVSVLDMRHYHRNLFFSGPNGETITEYGEAYARLQQEINELEELGVRDPDTPQPQEIRALARAYYEGFWPTVDTYDTDPAAFEEASNRGLRQLEQMDDAVEVIDKLGEQLTANSLARVDRAAASATFVLLAVVGGLLLVGAALAYAAVRVVGELRAASEQLAEASRTKTAFLADVSHELRTPLTVLQGNAEVGQALDPDWAHREILDEIVRESDRMTHMVEDLLFLARSDSAALPLEVEAVPVESFLAEISGRAEALTRERDARLEAKLLGEGEVRIDQRRMEQVVLILVDNAAKYGPQGGSRVLLTSTTKSGELCISTADNGPGIAEEELPRVFERFYRVDKARSRKLGGAGLGLPIAKAIVEAHEGRIEAESRLGQGTRMTIYLPLVSTRDDRRSERRFSKTSI